MSGGFLAQNIGEMWRRRILMRIFEDYDEDFVDFDFDLGEFGDFF